MPGVLGRPVREVEPELKKVRLQQLVNFVIVAPGGRCCLPALHHLASPLELLDLRHKEGTVGRVEQLDPRGGEGDGREERRQVEILLPVDRGHRGHQQVIAPGNVFPLGR